MCDDCKVSKYCTDKDHVIECFVKEDLETMAEQIRADVIEEFAKIIAMDIADCSKCPLDCDVNTYGGCEEMLKTYVLEQLKE